MSSDQKRMILAVVISGLILVIWQTTFGPVAPKQVVVNQQTGQPQVEGTAQALNPHPTAAPVVNQETAKATTTPAIQSMTLKSASQSLLVGSRLELSNFKSDRAAVSLQEMLGEQGRVALEVYTNQRWEPLTLSFQEGTEGRVEATDSDRGISVFLTWNEQRLPLLSVQSSTPYLYRIVFNATKKQLENRQVRQYIWYGQDVDRDHIGDDFAGEGSLKWVGVDFQHHVFTLMFNEAQVAKYQAFESGRWIVQFTNPTTNFQSRLFFGKKTYDELKAMGSNLHLAVDFGFFSVLAVPILRGLQFFYKYIPNYGIAIILITLLIRLITFPLQWKSSKSMKKMQKLQPQLKEIKEKYKDDPRRVQQETMTLFKTSGANPLGGCFPLLLQMPIFFAFYRVLAEAVELVGAPFFIWIQDLSLKDPYFVLPVLMTVAMVFQQRLTPTTSVDPAQKKIMMAMPLIFGFIMKDLPAGLNLYIFVSITFGMIQQLMVYKFVKD